MLLCALLIYVDAGIECLLGRLVACCVLDFAAVVALLGELLVRLGWLDVICIKLGRLVLVYFVCWCLVCLGVN